MSSLFSSGSEFNTNKRMTKITTTTTPNTSQKNNTENLENALIESLTQKGILQNLISELRKSIVECLQASSTKKALPLSKENEMINALICEYLEYNGYVCTKSVLLTESNHSSPVSSRKELERELHVTVDGEESIIPLLYYMVFNEPAKKTSVKKMVEALVKKNTNNPATTSTHSSASVS
ncbi:hypothetical protein HMI54_014579 [Coelomomyces lativittatus]|nr:hypothetical protein HMI55_002733 [Coelomomyces lativittatus]KAJ1503000.1 hypothetical protein HMI56_002392 [Coelomomyces lativittatus]KAJ1513966.1 hypothetical protein HMI54_014579 [Coelomomyces lativittatus]